MFCYQESLWYTSCSWKKNIKSLNQIYEKWAGWRWLSPAVLTAHCCSRFAVNVLGENALALTAVSPSLLQADKVETEQLAHQIGAQHHFFESTEIQDARCLANTPERCYFCKHDVYDHLVDHAKELGFDVNKTINLMSLRTKCGNLQITWEIAVGCPKKGVYGGHTPPIYTFFWTHLFCCSLENQCLFQKTNRNPLDRKVI